MNRARRNILHTSFYRNYNLCPANLRLSLSNLSSHGSSLHTSSNLHQQENSDDEDKKPVREISKIVNKVSVETSMRYLESQAYKTTYGDDPVWVPYRRNFKGQFAPKKTRPTCIKEDVLITGNPCPICRDEYLVIDFRNVKLLKQFVCPYTDKILFWDITCLCQDKQRRMEVAIEKSRRHGLLPFYVPFREYDYKDYYDFSSKTMKN
ncbi:28S ribosomal protein S18b, mitochondrial [Armadillidium nasatum]|uniref:Small ribosomal subunit protein mS40 n=1 Tax=Armadillidium nasatum TaxID=96803 RepID=A0A5N5TJG5_9CRUS|nr:28S ribosomal protein S18b, mitochondrial [Armadillidium nasatum]